VSVFEAVNIDITYTLSYTRIVKYIDWSDEKDALLKIERGVGFADVLTAIEMGGLLADMQHHSSVYRHQRIFIIRILGYAYVVPYVEDEEKVFLKTIIPSRVATRKYIKGDTV